MPFGLWFGESHLGFGTHVPILAAAVLQARPGPIVEYGCGLYSTPLLHMLCMEMDRDLLSLDSDPTWLARFSELQYEKHKFAAFPNWAESEALVDAREWAVAFIDHGPDERRVVDAKRLAHRAEFVLVHDWGGAIGEPLNASQQAIADMFEFRFVSRFGPCTAVLSNTRQFSM